MTIDLWPALGRAALYLGVPFMLMIFVMQWRWAKTCNENIRVLVAEKSGGGAWKLAPKEGGTVTITNSKDESTRTWPVNELATIDVLYPGVGFVPAFMQKTIRMAIVNEGDWEPMLNRSPHRENIASPDVIEFIQKLRDQLGNKVAKDNVDEFVNNLATGPTREMIADPAVLGNLMRSSIMKALATVSNDFMDILKSVNTKLGKVIGPNPYVVYAGLGLILIMMGYLIYTLIPALETLDILRQSLGIVK